MLVPLDKDTGLKKKKLSAQEQKDFDLAVLRGKSKAPSKARTGKYPGLRSPKDVGTIRQAEGPKKENK